MVSQVESCFADSQDYTACKNSALTNTGLNITGTDDTAPAANSGEVSVVSETVNGFTITAASKSGNTFSIQRVAGGPYVRACTGTTGGCKNSSW